MKDAAEVVAHRVYTSSGHPEMMEGRVSNLLVAVQTLEALGITPIIRSGKGELMVVVRKTSLRKFQ